MTARAINEEITRLTELEGRIARCPLGALTLDPNRPVATSLTEVVSSLADPQQYAHLAAAASSVAEAQLRSFPGNLFWDFDFYLASIHRDAAASADYASYVSKVTDITVGLLGRYGQQSSIRFRYVHDFMYGFDWARWVRRDPGARGRVEPFSIEFLRQTEDRAADIVALIEEDDDWYPRLAEGESRNPFPFSREPEDELSLYRTLAARADVPVEAWRTDARPDASRDFDLLREDAARSLDLRR